MNQAKPSQSNLHRFQTHPEIVLLAVIVLFALAIRLFNLGGFPDTLIPDEADNTQDALRIIYGQPPRGTFVGGFFGLDWTSQPAFSAYMLAATLRVFGESVLSTRLLSGVVSSLALVPFFFLLRRQFSSATSLLSTFLLACNLWYLNFSRSAWNNIHICFYMLMAMLCFVLALDRVTQQTQTQGRTQSHIWFLFAATGLFCALGLYGYPSGRNIILSLLVFFPVAYARFRGQARRLVLGYGIIVGVAAVLFAPELLTILNQWARFNTRSATVLITNSATFKQDPIGTMSSQLWRNVLGFWFGGAAYIRDVLPKRYLPKGDALLDVVTGLLMLGGMVYSVISVAVRRRYETWLWWLMFLVSWVSTELITSGTPDGARGIGWMPTLFFFVAAGIEGLTALLRGATLRAPHLAIAVPTTLVITAGLYNIFHYIEWQDQPDTRATRQPYVEVGAFPAWRNEIASRAEAGKSALTVKNWRIEHNLAPSPTPGSTKRATPGGDLSP